MFDRTIWFCLWSSSTAAQFSPLLGCSDFSCPSLIPAPHSSNNQFLLSARSSAHSCLDGHPVSLSPSFRDDFWSCYWFPKPAHGSCRRAALPVAFHSQHLHFASGLCKQGSLDGSVESAWINELVPACHWQPLGQQPHGVSWLQALPCTFRTCTMCRGGTVQECPKVWVSGVGKQHWAPHALAKNLTGVLTGAVSPSPRKEEEKNPGTYNVFRLISVSPLRERVTPGLKAKGIGKGRKSKRSSNSAPNYEFVLPDPLMTQGPSVLCWVPGTWHS